MSKRTRKSKEESKLESAKKRVKLNPSEEKAHLELAFAYEDRSDVEQAIRSYQHVLDINKQNQVALCNISRLFLNKQAFNQCLTYAKRLTTIRNPDKEILGKAYNNIGLAYQNMKAYDDARVWYEKALLLDKNNTIVLSNYANMLAEKKDLVDAANLYIRSLSINPNNGLAWSDLASLYHETKDFDNAISCYQKAVEFMNTNDYAWNNLGLCYVHKSDFHNAKEAFLTALKVNPKNTYAMFNMSVRERSSGNYEKAIEFAKQALNVDPIYPAAHNSLGVTYFELRRYDDAILHLSKAIENAKLVNPPVPFPEAYVNLANVYLKIGETENAIQFYQMAIKEEPENVESMISLADAHTTNNEYMEAIEWLLKASSIRHNNPILNNKLGRIYETIGKYNEAIHCYNQLLLIDSRDKEANRHLKRCKELLELEDSINL